jgi:hypothetical protein
MQIQCGQMGVGRRLTRGEKRADLRKKVIANPHEVASFGSFKERGALPGAFLGEEARFSLVEGEAVPVNRDTVSVIREHAGVPRLAINANVLLVVKICFRGRIDQENLGGGIKLDIPGTEHDFISAIPVVKLPGSLEQLKKFAHNIMIRGICDDANHCECAQASVGTG